MNIYKTPLFKYIAGDSLVGKSVPMTIDRVVVEEVEGQGGKKEDKLVLYFVESQKGMILNKTNAKRIAKLFTGETDDWKGKTIELYTEPVKAFGETHNALRVRESKLVKQAKAAKVQAETSTPQDRQARLAANGNALHGKDEGAIGEDTDADRFADDLMKHVPYYTSRPQVFMALAALGMTYSEEAKEMCFDALAHEASRQADAMAN